VQIVETSDAPVFNARSIGVGVASVKTLLEGKEDTPSNFRMNFGSADEGWEVPRHRHNFVQVRYRIQVSSNISPARFCPPMGRLLS